MISDSNCSNQIVTRAIYNHARAIILLAPIKEARAKFANLTSKATSLNQQAEELIVSSHNKIYRAVANTLNDFVDGNLVSEQITDLEHAAQELSTDPTEIINHLNRMVTEAVKDYISHSEAIGPLLKELTAITEYLSDDDIGLINESLENIIKGLEETRDELRYRTESGIDLRPLSKPQELLEQLLADNQNIHSEFVKLRDSGNYSAKAYSQIVTELREVYDKLVAYVKDTMGLLQNVWIK